MRAICFIQETKEADLTMRQQQLVCRRALRKLLWRCEAELFAQVGTEQASLALRPGMTELLKMAALAGWMCWSWWTPGISIAAAPSWTAC